METYKEEKGKIRRCIYQSKKKVNEQFGRKMNKDINGNRKLFWKEMSNEKGGKVESCSRKKDRNWRLVQGENEVQKMWKEYFEDLYNIDTQEQDAVYMCSFDGSQRGNYFGKAEVEVRVGKLKNGKAAGKDEITGEIIIGGGDRMVCWINLKVMLYDL